MANGHQCAFILLATPITFRLLRYGCRFKEWRESDWPSSESWLNAKSVSLLLEAEVRLLRGMLCSIRSDPSTKTIAELSAV